MCSEGLAVRLRLVDWEMETSCWLDDQLQGYSSALSLSKWAVGAAADSDGLFSWSIRQPERHWVWTCRLWMTCGPAFQNLHVWCCFSRFAFGYGEASVVPYRCAWDWVFVTCRIIGFLYSGWRLGRCCELVEVAAWWFGMEVDSDWGVLFLIVWGCLQVGWASQVRDNRESGRGSDQFQVDCCRGKAGTGYQGQGWKGSITILLLLSNRCRIVEIRGSSDVKLHFGGVDAVLIFN